MKESIMSRPFEQCLPIVIAQSTLAISIAMNIEEEVALAVYVLPFVGMSTKLALSREVFGQNSGYTGFIFPQGGNSYCAHTFEQGVTASTFLGSASTQQIQFPRTTRACP